MKTPHTLIIAEAGVNHNGSMELAKELIDVACDAGADYVKFQTFKAESLVTQTADKAEYQKNVTDNNESQFDMLEKLSDDCSFHFFGFFPGCVQRWKIVPQSSCHGCDPLRSSIKS